MSDKRTAGPTGEPAEPATGQGESGLGNEPADPLRALAELNPLPVYVWDTARNEVWSNRPFDVFFGRPDSGAAFSWWQEQIHPEDRAMMEQKIADALQGTATSFSNTYRYRRYDGSYVPIRDYGHIFRDERHAPTRVMGCLEDLSPANRTKHSLASAESRLKAIIENTPNVAIEAYDRLGRVLIWNPAAERIFGWSAGEALGRTLDQLILDETATAEFVQTLREIERTGKPTDLTEWSFTRRDGSTGTVLSSIFPITSSEGVMQFICMDVDVTERKQAEDERERLYRQAMEADRRKDEFLATVSHELRTPLTPILGWAGLLQRGGAAPELVVKAAQSIDRSARNQARLIDDLLEISRIVAGKERLNLRPMALESVVLAAVETARSAASNKMLDLDVDIEPGLPPTHGDPTRLEQVTWNLLSNALKFTPRGGRISVRLRQVGDELQLTIQDTGCGIEPHFLPYVFERFRQAENPVTRTQGGLGLGLAIVRHLAELHGGTVEAISEGVGKGATFSVNLPVFSTDEPDASATATDTEAPSLEGMKVLLVEDDAESREILAQVLKLAGAQVIRVESAADALQAIERQWPDLLVSDIALPGEDGVTLLERARCVADSRGRSLPAIAVSALAAESDQQRARAAGYGEYLVKPVRPEQLLEAAARWILPGAPSA